MITTVFDYFAKYIRTFYWVNMLKACQKFQVHQKKWSEAVQCLQHAIRGYPACADLWEVYGVWSILRLCLGNCLVICFFNVDCHFSGSRSFIPSFGQVYSCYKGTTLSLLLYFFMVSQTFFVCSYSLSYGKELGFCGVAQMGWNAVFLCCTLSFMSRFYYIIYS